MRLRNIAVTTGTGLSLCADLVFAHPGLVSSMPASGESLDSPPKVMQLKFNEPIERAFTGVRLFSASGREVLRSDSQPDSATANVVVVQLPALSSGSYRAIWSAVGRDGHRIRGEFSFSVK